MMKSFNEEVWELVEIIPRGCVASYGQLATMLGHPRRGRQVGHALHKTPDDRVLPWHRVINSQGRISFNANSEQYLLQKAMLEAERVRFKENDQIDMRVYGWQP